MIDYESDIIEFSIGELEEYCSHLNQIDEPDSYGDTVLLAACKNRNFEHVNYCLGKGANPDFRKNLSDTPLLELIDTAEDNEDVSIPIIKALIGAGANLEIRGYMDKTPFLKACSRKSLTVLKLLVDSGCNTRATITEHGEELDGNWFADCFNLSSNLKEYIRNAIKNS